MQIGILAPECLLVPLVVEVGTFRNAGELGQNVLWIAELVAAGDLDVFHRSDSWSGAAASRLRVDAERAE